MGHKKDGSCEFALVAYLCVLQQCDFIIKSFATAHVTGRKNPAYVLLISFML